MKTLRLRQLLSAAFAVLGFAAFGIRSLDPDDMVGEWGFFAITIGCMGVVSLVVLTAVPGIARIYAMGWADRDQQCSCSESLASHSQRR